MKTREKIKEYLSKEDAFKPRYKHQMGEHPQKRHGNRGTRYSESHGAVIPEGATAQDAYEYAKYVLNHKPGDPLPTEGARQLSERIFNIGGFETYGDWARDTTTKINLHNLFSSDPGVLTNEDRENLRKIAKFDGGFNEYAIKLVNPMKEEEMRPEALEHEWGISKYGIRPAEISYVGVGSWDFTKTGGWIINIAKNAESFGLSKRNIFWHEFGHTVGSHIVERFIGKQSPLETSGDYIDRFADKMTNLSSENPIENYLSKEDALKPRYKHQMGEHPQRRHGNRGTVRQETPGGRAVGGVVTIGMNDATYAGGQFLPSTTMQKMTATARKYEKKYATEEERYLNTKQEIQPYVWEKPPSTDHKSFHFRINGFIPHSGYRETYRYDTERARAMKPPYPNKQIVKQAERDATGKVIVYHGSKWVPMTRDEWIKEIELAEKFNRGERWETGYDTARAKTKIHDIVYAFVKEGRSADEIKSFFAGQNTQGRDIDDLIYRSGILVDQNNGNYVYGSW